MFSVCLSKANLGAPPTYQQILSSNPTNAMFLLIKSIFSFGFHLKEERHQGPIYSCDVFIDLFFFHPYFDQKANL